MSEMIRVELGHQPVGYTHSGATRKGRFIKCSCNKIHKIEGGDSPSTCPECGRVHTYKDLPYIETRTYMLMYPYTINLFLDEESISLAVSIESIHYNGYMPIHGREKYTYKFKYNLTKKTNLFYKVFSQDGETQIRRAREFVNITLPKASYYEYGRGIDNSGVKNLELPGELIDKIVDKIGVDFPGRERGSNFLKGDLITPLDIGWLNRLRENYSLNKLSKMYITEMTDRVEPVRDELRSLILNSLNYAFREESVRVSENIDTYMSHTNILRLYKGYKDVYASLSDLQKEHAGIRHQDIIRCYQSYKDKMRNITKYKRLISPKNEYLDQKKLFEVVADEFNFDHSKLSNAAKKMLLLNPHHILTYAELSSIFTNTDILLNVIKNVNIRDRYDINIHSIQHIDKEELKLVFARGDVQGEKAENMLQLRIANKLKSRFDLNVLRDTVDMMLKIKRYGVKFDTKGTIYELHEKARPLLNKLKTPKVSFLMADGITDEKIIHKKDEYILKYAKNATELIDIGENMNICVGSYIDRCFSGNTVIFYIQKNGKDIACMELYSRDKNDYELMQAKAVNNEYVGEDIQEIIANHCIEHGYMIRTYDMADEFKDKVKMALAEARDAQDLDLSQTFSMAV